MNKLCEYLDFRGIKHNVFAEKIGTSITTMHKILKKGHIPHLFTAIAIEEETNGKIGVYDWSDKSKAEKNKKKQNNHA